MRTNTSDALATPSASRRGITKEGTREGANKDKEDYVLKLDLTKEKNQKREQQRGKGKTPKEG